MVGVGRHQHRLVPLCRARLVGDGRRQRGGLVVAGDAEGRRGGQGRGLAYKSDGAAACERYLGAQG